MKIKLYWPRCNYFNNRCGEKGIDSYWVECKYQEAEKKVFPYLSPEQILESKRNWERREKNSRDIGIETERLCFLISKDLESISPMAWYYPYAGQWNAYCPFIKIQEIEINDLKDICNIIVETNDNKEY